MHTLMTPSEWQWWEVGAEDKGGGVEAGVVHVLAVCCSSSTTPLRLHRHRGCPGGIYISRQHRYSFYDLSANITFFGPGPGGKGQVPCCPVLCCAVLCCGVLCCAVVCCAVLWCAVLCCAVLCCAVLCCAVLSAVLCCAVLSAVPCRC